MSIGWSAPKSRSVGRLVTTDAPLCVMSVHGEIGTSAAASGSPSALARSISETLIPPPAESPVTATCFGSTPPSRIALYTAVTSSSWVGYCRSGVCE